MLRGEHVVAVIGKYHGLGNRLRVTLGAKSLAEWAGREFHYTWPTGAQFGSRFTDLWQFDAHRIPVGISHALRLRHPYRRQENLNWVSGAAGDRVWQIRTPHALHLPEGAVPWGQKLRDLRPVEDISARITSFYWQHLAGEPYVGVMVRAHTVSNAKTLEKSPIEWYIARMRRIREERPGIRFFVSADTPQAQETVLGAVPGSVALDDKGGYNTDKALRSSVVDLYLLASAGHLIGPYFSSFPEVAQQLAGARLRLETSGSAADQTLAEKDVISAVADPLRPARGSL